MRLGRDGIAGLIGLGVSLVLLPQALGLPKLPIVPVGPGFYPSLVLIFMAATSGALLLQDVLARRRSPPDGMTPLTDAAPAAYGLVAVAFVVVAAYVAALPLLGFRIATTLFVAVFQVVLDRPATTRQWLVVAAIAIATSAITYAVFEHYLLVLLPRGAWTGW